MHTHKHQIFAVEAGTPVWQRNYYERIIRNNNELNKIRQYIQDNPYKWDEDKDNPLNIQKNKPDTSS